MSDNAAEKKAGGSPTPATASKPGAGTKKEDEKFVPPQKQAYSFASFRILIVEDYPFMAELLTSMLREFGVGEFMLAESAKDAREIVTLCNAEATSRKQIDLIVVDWLMPDQDGVEFVEWLRAHKKDSVKFLPVILCSAYTSQTVVEKGRDSGASEVLVKPVSAEKLAKRILHIVDQPTPFVKTPDFFGPDRRRQDKKYPGEDRRIMTEDDVQVHKEK